MASGNGKEFDGHKHISREIQCEFLFALPHHPWERGSNENTNALLREYFPKGESFKQFTKTEIKNHKRTEQQTWKMPGLHDASQGILKFGHS